MKNIKTILWTAAGLVALGALTLAPAATADQVILDDLIVDGSACIGQDCVNGESFGFDTIRIKENNLRIRAVDTSSTASFPSNDWQITFNDSSNGGANKFSIDDIDGGRTPFTIEAGAPSHSLYVDDGGRIGLGTSTPVACLHCKDGNTPTLRLEQDGSSGFTPQTWDLAGNEANFFIRDATNGSTLPFRIEPGAPSNMIYIDGTDDRVGIGTSSPTARLDVSTSGAGDLAFALNRTGGTPQRWVTFIPSGSTTLTWFGGTSPQMTLDTSGNLVLSGECADAAGGGPNGCTADHVFEPDYELMGLDELAEFVAENRHLPRVPSADETREGGLNLNYMNGRLLEKIEELVLYTLQQQDQIDELSAKVVADDEVDE